MHACLRRYPIIWHNFRIARFNSHCSYLGSGILSGGTSPTTGHRLDSDGLRASATVGSEVAAHALRKVGKDQVLAPRFSMNWSRPPLAARV